MKPLTPRELDVLVLMDAGCSQRQIAHLLGISRSSVQEAQRRIRTKTPEEEAA